MEKEFNYTDIRKAFGKFSASSVKKAFTKSGEETPDARVKKLVRKIDGFVYELDSSRTALEKLSESKKDGWRRKLKISDEERQSLKEKARLLGDELANSLSDVGEYLLENSSSLTEEEVDGVEKMFEATLTDIVEVIALSDEFIDDKCLSFHFGDSITK